jgi:hypothetical protein
MTISTFSPQWIAKMYAGKTGRDHLGLGSVSSDQILPSLSPSINVLTFHPRYHSFYVFLLDEYWQRVPEKSRKHWVAFYRPREFIYSLGVYLHEGKHGDMANVVGGQKTSPLAFRALDAYPSNYDYIDSDMGGYGLYYRTVMAELELIYLGGPGYPTPVDVPSEFGREVAAAFRKSIEHTEYYKNYFDHTQPEIPTTVIREYIESACLCKLKRPDAPEHEILLESFLTRGAKKDAVARTLTFRLFLDVAAQTNGSAVDEDQFRQLIYFQQTNNRLKYSPKPELKEIFVRWRLYQMREYYSFALNALWYFLCAWGMENEGHLQPLPIAGFWEHMESCLRFDPLFSMLEIPKQKFSHETGLKDLLDWLRKHAIGKHNDIEGPYDVQGLLSEHQLYQFGSDTPWSERVIPAMTLLLLLVYLRLEDKKLRMREEWEINQMGRNGRLSVDRYMRQLDTFLKSGAVTVGEFLHWIFQDYVIVQHQGVATNKLPDNTFRFQRQGDKLRFYYHENFLGFMNSRYDALATTVHELGLCGDLRTEKHPLTQEGRQLLTRGSL